MISQFLSISARLKISWPSFSLYLMHWLINYYHILNRKTKVHIISKANSLRMTENLWIHESRKTPPDKPGPSGAAMGYRRRIDRRATAMLVLLLQLLYLSDSVAA